jgi:hypothetical protein
MLNLLTPSLQEREKAEVLLKEMEAQGRGPFKIKFYPGTFHGFAIRWVLGLYRFCNLDMEYKQP